MDPITTGFLPIFIFLLVIGTAICGGLGFFVFVLGIVGYLVLRKRGGEEKVTAAEAVSAGVESVSQVFIRGQGGLQALDDDEDDEDDE